MANRGQSKQSDWDFPLDTLVSLENRNSLLFEGFLFTGEQTCKKATEEATLWLNAQTGNPRNDRGNWSRLLPHNTPRRTPEDAEEFKCSIGVRLVKTTKVVGAAWVLSNMRGDVLLHSRRSFGAVDSKDEAYFLSLAWAIESMLSHRCLKIYFVLEGGNLVHAMNRPDAWPSFKFKVTELRLLLTDFLTWRIALEPFHHNRGARLIATSAVSLSRFQSYVARGYPSWLSHMFGCDQIPY